MNNTKWEELRLAMYGVEPAPKYRCKMLNGHYSYTDAEWFYHFRDGGYEGVRYVDIFAESQPHREAIRSALTKIHLPGIETDDGFRVYGYALPDQFLDYL
jgi:hypothetical protein